jgi:serine/threonine-protein kinase
MQPSRPVPPAGEPPEAAPRQIGRYRLYGEIAHGGMATVHFGRLVGPVGFARTVAIKRLHPQFAKDPEFVSMFLDEARLAARIHHPNVVATLDVVTTKSELFLVMDYVHGEPLSRLLRVARPPLPVLSAILVGVLHGLHAAHEAHSERGRPLEIVHRDVSPQNVLVGIDGVARVLDFGVAKASHRSHSTQQGQLKGKLRYMAPEQVRGETVTRQTDVYAAGVVLHEALTGRRLFDHDEASAIIAQIILAEIPAPSSVEPSVPPALDAIVLRAVARKPSDRYRDAQEMALDLEERVGIASPSQVATWVRSIVRDALDSRAAQVAEIESDSAAIPGRSSPFPPLPSAPPAAEVVRLGVGDEPTAALTATIPAFDPSQHSTVSVTRSAAPGRRSIDGRTWAALALVPIAVAVVWFLKTPAARVDPPPVPQRASAASAPAPSTPEPASAPTAAPAPIVGDELPRVEPPGPAVSSPTASSEPIRSKAPVGHPGPVARPRATEPERERASTPAARSAPTPTPADDDVFRRRR